MKKVVSLFLSVLLLLSITAGISISVQADMNGDFEYFVLDDGTAEITGYNGSATELVIPSEIGGHTVVRIGIMAFYDNKNLKSVAIPNSVTYIGPKSFQRTGLVDVVIPDSVSHLGYSAFENCADLTSVTFSKNLETIPEYSFLSCTSLKSVVIPENISLINCAFERYTALVILNNDCEFGLSLEDIEGTGGAAIYGYKNSTAQEYAEECGRPFIAMDQNLIISDSTDTEYIIGSEKGVMIHCAYALSQFVSVSVNGKIVDESYYTLKEGSTMLTFKSAYLDTLEPGEYKVILTYTNGIASTTLTVFENTDAEVPVVSPGETEKQQNTKESSEATENMAEDTDSTERKETKKSPSTGARREMLATVAAGICACGAVLAVRKKI